MGHGTDIFPSIPGYATMLHSEHGKRSGQQEGNVEVEAWNIAAQLFAQMPANYSKAIDVLDALTQQIENRLAAGGYPAPVESSLTLAAIRK